MAIFVAVKESLKNKNIQDGANYYQTGLFLPDQEFISWSIKFIYRVKDHIGITTALSGGARTEKIARTPVISAGFYIKWKEKMID